MRSIATAAACAALFSACSGSGSSSANEGAAFAGYGLIELVGHLPQDGAVQVPVDTAITLEFDTAVALDSLGDEDTWLRPLGGDTDVAGSYTVGGDGRTVTFRPQAPLAIETDYVFQLSGLTCDNSGRLLDQNVTFEFRTLDVTPPSLQQVSVVENATGVSRTGAFTFTFSEAIAKASLTPTSLALRDVFGATYAGSRQTSGNTVTFTPFSDLPGDRQLTLELSGTVTDRAGNGFGSTVTRTFMTEGDGDSPSVLSMWPAPGKSGISPAVQPTYTFNESMDPGSVEPSSLSFQDQFGSVIPFGIHASDDQRTLRVEPRVLLQPNRTYTLAFLLGGAGATDVSGNTLSATQALQFTTGTDTVPPAVTASTPTPGETRVSLNAILEVTFDGDLDDDWVNAATVRLTSAGEELASVVELAAPNVVRVVPVLELPTGADCTLTLQGGHEGLHDLAGNVMPADTEVSFSTAADSSLPRALMMPPDGATGVPVGAHVSIVFDAPMDPSTMTSSTIEVLDDTYHPIGGDLEILGQNRIARFTPTPSLFPSTYYRVRIRGGSAGVRRVSGNWFATDREVRFRTGIAADVTPPIVRASVNDIAADRATGLVLPPFGFTVDVTVNDPGDQSLDMSTVEVLLAGDGSGPGPAALFAAATVDYSTFRVQVPESAALGAGSWTLTVRATDLSGNVATSPPFAFEVAPADAAAAPFERVQVVWVRTDLDRDGSGTDDFTEDQLRLGLGTAGDPIGANARLRQILLDGIIAKANELYGRGRRGEPLDSASVWLRFTPRAPIAIQHMQIALGGFDPEGPGGRDYGDESSGVLGRAYYDYRNGNFGERNTGQKPGLGVFPTEMWLYQTHIHLQVWPAYQTTFAQRFRPLAPAMGGTPAGSHALDPIVLAEGFDYGNGNSSERARWLTIMQAADDWATVIGIILAHEVGHSVGLVAPGPTPRGLFGDSSLHDTYAGAAEVMAPAVGYEAMLTLDYHFRDIDLAYLRQRILLR
ncbi:MAG: Ig-like domain-containing protein [Planctomycetes bacterium]|nr:Ig-like domain-containing protein [Planctomycetota bacterium]